MTYFKAVREDGKSFHSNSVKYEVGQTVTHPTPHKRDASGYLSVATVATDCTGMSWPCRLFEVEPIGETWQPDPDSLPNKVACHELRVVRELDATEALGPQGAQLKDLIGQAGRLTEVQANDLYAARGAAWDAAWYAARGAAWYAARGAAWDAARGAARDAARGAALALCARDLIGEGRFTQEHYDLLTGPWRKVVGPLHEDDADLRAQS